MTNEQWKHELSYQAAMALAREMLRRKVIAEDDYNAIDDFMIAKFRPLLAGLRPNIT